MIRKIDHILASSILFFEKSCRTEGALRSTLQRNIFTFVHWVLQSFPQLTQALFQLGVVHASLGQWKQALACYESMLKNGRSLSYLFYHKMAEALLRLRRLEEALAYVRVAIELNHEYQYSHQLEGEVLSRQGEFEKSIDSFRRAISLDPDFGWSYHGLGEALIRTDQFDESIEPLRRAIEINPHFRWSYELLGVALIQQGRLEHFLQLCHEAVAKNNGSQWPYVYLGDALSEIGAIQEAVIAYQKASGLQLSATHPHFFPNPKCTDAKVAPDFIIIGKAKCGTTSLYSYVVQHPEILPAIKKEIYFWCSYYERGMDWYLAHFPSIAGGQGFLTGEASVSYLESKDSAVRLRDAFPGIKLIIILRNPVDQVISAYQTWVRLGCESRSLKEAVITKLDPPIVQRKTLYPITNFHRNYFKSGMYVEKICFWMEIFPRNQFLILKSETLFEQLDDTMQEVFDFLGVPPHQISKYSAQNSGYNLPADDSTRAMLHEFFLPYNRRLEEFLGMKFNWGE